MTKQNLIEERDFEQINSMGITLEKIEKDVECFKKGFPFLQILRAAAINDGIELLTEREEEEAIEYYSKAQVAGKCKFIPASGAASRMFKDVFSDLERLKRGESLTEESAGKKIIEHIEDFAFYNEKIFPARDKNMDLNAYHIDLLERLIGEKGLAYGTRPKGIILFHSYEDGECRSAFEEHLLEAQDYMRESASEQGTAREVASGQTKDSANLVFTVSKEHKRLFEDLYNRVKENFEKRHNIHYNVSFECQDAATNTIAVDLDNNLFRTDDGKLLFRPAGHGALIYNLNNIDEELISIKNIDNVANDKLLPITSRYKKVLMGRCLELRDKIFAYLRVFDELLSFSPVDEGNEELRTLCDEVEDFLKKQFCMVLPVFQSLSQRASVLRAKLNRPIRVCGMVKNEGEAGGGPFIVMGKDGVSSLQILEGGQIDLSNERIAGIAKKSSYFNPVDIVCCIRDYKGQKFDLLRFVDWDTAFISEKSYGARQLKALELPGLWNGAMSDWNTAFVEVPLASFNPVKVVLDLLRANHRS